ncbi:DUF302 domain-containing protein [Neorhizobium sp. Rsf11]|uniref:DUF302 domain-containing protein n=2 Tax=Neorhizobium TaxID=1525371 RepID=A0ABV0M2B0_9HYPH|nr:DUF302 domain-containing protein [Neorhizobium petrolearium]MCC2612064.1 DUF302 domain-containing protein [Neorhizobium petrolearium]WGI67222.1 DUF302 domain-containing protein [Neorhizobium petrolearium]
MIKIVMASLVALPAALGCTGATASDVLKIYESKAPFAEVLADLEDAIVNRGYVVDYHGHVAEMLARTAGDVGAGKVLYREAEFMQFCSATVSRKAMEADLANIGFCPYVLFAYEAEAAPGTVKVGFRRLPEGEARDDVNSLLDDLVREASGN